MSRSTYRHGRRAGRRLVASAAVVASSLFAVTPADAATVILDLRVHDTGGKEATVTGAGEQVLLELYGTVIGHDGDPDNDSINLGSGTFKSSAGGLLGDLIGLFPPAPFNQGGSTDGVQADLDGDGDLDIGNNEGTAHNAYAFRSGFIAPNPPGGQLLGRVLFVPTVMSDQTTEVHYLQRMIWPGLLAYIDGVLLGVPDGFSVQAPDPVLIRGVTAVDPGDTQYLDGSIVSHLTVANNVRVTPGGTLTLARGVDVTATGTLEPGSGALSIRVNDATSGNAGGRLITGEMSISTTSNGTFTHSGGLTRSVSGVNVGAAAGLRGALAITGGTFEAGTVIVSAGGTGQITLDGGNASFTALEMREGAQLQMSGGTLSVALQTRVGQQGDATFTHIDGQTSLGDLQLGVGGGTGRILIQGGHFAAGRTQMGADGSSPAHLNQTGGTFNVGALTMNPTFNGASAGVSYALSSGTLAAASIVLGDQAVLTQSGGAIAPAGQASTFIVGSHFGTDATQYHITAGTVTAPLLKVWHTNSAPLPGSGRAAGIVQSGGAVSAGFLSIEEQGSYDATGGTLEIGTDLKLIGKLDFGNSAFELLLRQGAFGDFVGGQLRNAQNATFFGEAGSLMSFASQAQLDGVGSIQTQGLVHIAGQGLVIPPDQTVGGSGTIAGDVTNQGAIAPGGSPGKFGVQGSYEQTESGALVIEIGGTDPEQFDLLEISGSASLDGLLDLSLLDGFLPQATDSFTILTAAGITGMFDNAMGTVDFAGGRFDVSYLSNEVTLSNFQAVPEPAGVAVCCVVAAVAMRRRCRSGDSSRAK